MAPPLSVIKGAGLLRVIASKIATTTKNNKFLVGATSLSLGIPKVVDWVGGDTEFEEAVESQLADGMTSNDVAEVKKSVNFITSMFEDGLFVQPLKDGQMHRYLIIDFVKDSASLVVNRNQARATYDAFKRGQDSQLLNRNKSRRSSR